MSQSEMVKVGIALAGLYALYRFAPQAAVKAMALGAAGTIVAARLPYIGDAF